MEYILLENKAKDLSERERERERENKTIAINQRAKQ